MMTQDRWGTLARSSAAREWGKRHYRFYAWQQYGGAVVAAAAWIAMLAAVSGLGIAVAIWVHPVVALLAVSAASGGALLARWWWLMITPRPRSGGSLGLAILATMAMVALVGAVIVS